MRIIVIEPHRARWVSTKCLILTHVIGCCSWHFCGRAISAVGFSLQVYNPVPPGPQMKAAKVLESPMMAKCRRKVPLLLAFFRPRFSIMTMKSNIPEYLQIRGQMMSFLFLSYNHRFASNWCTTTLPNFTRQYRLLLNSVQPWCPLWRLKK